MIIDEHIKPSHFTDLVNDSECYTDFPVQLIVMSGMKDISRCAPDTNWLDPFSPALHLQRFPTMFKSQQYLGGLPGVAVYGIVDQDEVSKHAKQRRMWHPLTSFIPIELELSSNSKELEEAILNARVMTEWQANWNDEGALPISTPLFEATADFLRKQSRVLSNSGVKLAVPEINPNPQGSIDLSWRTAKARLLINIRLVNEIPQAYFYGDLYNNQDPVKGKSQLSPFPEYISVWMKFLGE